MGLSLSSSSGGLGEVRPACRVGSTVNVASLSGLPVIDGVQTADGDRVLLLGQTDGRQNGPWVVSTGAWSRPSDYADGATVNPNTVYAVSEGTALPADSRWQITTNGTVTVGTTATTWARTGTLVHSELSGLSADDHAQYALADGSRAFTGPVGGVNPVASGDLATAAYVDTADATVRGEFFALRWERNRGTLPEPFWHVRLGDVLYDVNYVFRDVTPRGIMFKSASANLPTPYAGGPPNGTGFSTGWTGGNVNAYLMSQGTASSSILNPTTFSVSGWFRLNALPGTNVHYILAARYNGGTGNIWQVQLWNAAGTTKLIFDIYDGVTTLIGEAAVTVSLATDTWYFFCATLSGTAMQVRLTTEGATSLGTAGTDTATANIGSANTAYTIGGFICPGCERLINGQIAEVSFFRNYALTQQDEEDMAGVNASGGAQVNRLFAA